MKFDYVHTYEADPQRVVSLLRTEAFLDDVASHAGAVEHTVDVAPDSASLGMSLRVPEKLAKFVGSTIRINQVFRFGAPGSDGSIPGTVEVDVPGMPVDVTATAVLRPQGSGTTGHYSGDLKVRIPLVGKKVEAQVEPFIKDAFDGLERRAGAWLSSGRDQS